MNTLIRSLVVCVFVLFPILLNGQNNYHDKMVVFPAGQISLQSALKILSDQTGCVFSYDPTKIIDKQVLSVSKYNNLTLGTALQIILPKSINFKFNGKYVVLQKTDLIEAKTIKKNVVKKSSVKTKKAQGISNLFDGFKITEPIILDMELAGNKHLATFSTHLGLNNVYSIFSFGYDYFGSYHLGIGAGVNFKLDKRVGINIDLVQYGMVAGKSIKLNTRAYTTQLSPVLNYSIGQRVKIFAGPSVYLINTSIVKGTSTSESSNVIGYSAILGIRINLSTPQKF
ncbi:MAG: hypothetical protein Q7U47_02460 [Paludibacter sp.]|nr:hypothetical protein [Paludibacter sp.]